MEKSVFAKFIFSFTAITFMWFSVFGLMTTMMAMEMGMPNCFLMNDMTHCTMGINQHINIWNTIFNSLLPAGAAVSVYLIAIALLFIFLPLLNGILGLSKVETGKLLYQKNNPPGLIPNSFKEALSQGIVNPKIF